MAEAAGLRINNRKTKLISINAKNTQPLILEGEDIEEVERFLYILGNYHIDRGGAEDDVKLKARIRKSNVAFIQLYPIWRYHNISKRTKCS